MFDKLTDFVLLLQMLGTPVYESAYAVEWDTGGDDRTGDFGEYLKGLGITQKKFEEIMRSYTELKEYRDFKKTIVEMDEAFLQGLKDSLK